ncbi:MAG: alginate lyase family protein [Clostridia bacterium]|nr:alginate lyase family protein [Clostridia bacterium]
MDFVLISKEHAQATREKVRAGKGIWDEVAFGLRKSGEAAMEKGPWSVTFASRTAPSGNPHDYFSEGPYWWPNPEDPDGPYIRRDGLIYPGRFDEHHSDFGNLSNAVLDLVNAGYYLEDEKYLDRAACLLNVWFVDEATRMNPNMRYGQGIKGHCDGRCIGLIELTAADKVAHALGFLSEYEKYAATVAGVKKWMNEFLDWLLIPDGFGWEELRHGNNHSGWCVVHAMYFAALNDREDVVRMLADFYKESILEQIEPDGSMPLELARTRSYHYSLYGMIPMVLTCELARKYGIDLWECENSKGGSLRKAAEFMYPYMENPFAWPYEQIVGDHADDILFYQYAAARLNEPKYAEVNRKRREGFKYIRNQNPMGPLCLLEGEFLI